MSALSTAATRAAIKPSASLCGCRDAQTSGFLHALRQALLHVLGKP